MALTQAELIDQEAERMTSRHYISLGYYGGKSTVSGGKVVSRKLFDFSAVKAGYVADLTKNGFGLKVEGK